MDVYFVMRDMHDTTYLEMNHHAFWLSTVYFMAHKQDITQLHQFTIENAAN